MVKRTLLALLVLVGIVGVGFTSDEVPQVLKTFPSKETWFLPSGTVLKGTTQNSIFSFNLECPVVVVLDEPAPVSYTHLDVYKRQALGSALPSVGKGAGWATAGVGKIMENMAGPSKIDKGPLSGLSLIHI